MVAQPGETMGAGIKRALGNFRMRRRTYKDMAGNGQAPVGATVLDCSTDLKLVIRYGMTFMTCLMACEEEACDH